MFAINREDWDLLQAVKAAGLTVEKLQEMDTFAPEVISPYDESILVGYSVE